MANRRKVLLTISACGVGSLAGCTNNTGTGESSSNTDDGSESSTDDDNDREGCTGSPVEILSIDDDDPSDLTVSLQNRANTEARYMIEVTFTGAQYSEKTERVSGTIGAKLNKGVSISGGRIKNPSDFPTAKPYFEIDGYEMTLNSECL